MKDQQDHPLIRLGRERERTLRDLEERGPDIAALIHKLRGLDEDIAVQQRGVTQLYATLHGTKAVVACLKQNGRFMDKAAVVDALSRGGYPLDALNGPRLMIELIKKNVQREVLVEDAQGRVGLPDFPNPLPMTPADKARQQARKPKT